MAKTKKNNNEAATVAATEEQLTPTQDTATATATAALLTSAPPSNMVVFRFPAHALDINDDYNGRRYHNEGINDLAKDLLATGRQLQPIGVRPMSTPDGEATYSVVYGFRRAKALKSLAESGKLSGDSPLAMVECIDLGELTDVDAFSFNIRENAARRDLNAIDMADALDRMITGMGMTVKAAAAAFGKSSGWASQTMALNRLPEEVKKLVAKGAISPKAAYDLSTVVDDPEAFTAALESLQAAMAEAEAGGGKVTQTKIRKAIRDAEAGDGDEAGDEGEDDKPARKKATPLSRKEIYDALVDRQQSLEEDLPPDVEYWGGQWELIVAIIKFCDGRLKARGLWNKADTLLPNKPKKAKKEA